MKNTGTISMSTFPLKPGKEGEFFSLWQQGLAPLMREMGATNVSIYYNKEQNHYVSTAHWESETRFHSFSRAEKLQFWMDAANGLCRSTPVGETYQIIQAKAA